MLNKDNCALLFSKRAKPTGVNNIGGFLRCCNSVPKKHVSLP